MSTEAKQAGEPAAVYRDPKTLIPWKRNPRKNDPAVDAVAESIQRFGFGSPILAREDGGEIIAGHTRIKAAIKLGLTQVPVRYLPLSEAEAHALALADNKLGEIATWDDAGLAAVFAELEAGGEPTAGLGWEADEIDALLASDSAAGLPEPEDDAPPLRAEAESRLGEVYELGPHRLACGDCGDADVWARLLLPEERLDMVWTDPPYGVSYVGKTAEKKTIKNDSLTAPELREFLRVRLGMAAANCTAGAVWYAAAPPAPLHYEFATVLLDLGIWRQTLIWEKQSLVLGYSDFHYRHEPIFYGWIPGAAHHVPETRVLTSILQFDRPTASKEHPTMKPIALVQFCIEASSDPGQIVGDPFGGSGTTLLAAAASGRIARTIELDPVYCDVIRRRWTKYAQGAGLDPGPGALE